MKHPEKLVYSLMLFQLVELVLLIAIYGKVFNV